MQQQVEYIGPSEPGIPRPPTQDELPYDDSEPMETRRHVLQMYLLLDALLHVWQETEIPARRAHAASSFAYTRGTPPCENTAEFGMTTEDLGLEPFESDPQLAEIPPEKVKKSYTGAKRMSEKYVEKGPYEFFPDAVTVELVQRGLAKNELLYGKRYCPWMTLSGDPAEDRLKICPCDRHHEDIARDGFCIWMFFVSEEFLRKYESGEAFGSTLDEVTEAGESLFPDAHGESPAERRSKAERAEEARRRSEGGTSG